MKIIDAQSTRPKIIFPLGWWESLGGYLSGKSSSNGSRGGGVCPWRELRVGGGVWHRASSGDGLQKITYTWRGVAG
eukprot:3115965-Pleurochrysis_carterae.AAC.2